MKTKSLKLVFFSFTQIFLLVSCKYMTGVNSSSVRKKTSMGNFEHLNNPIVCSFSVETGIKGFSPTFGTIYYVFDWENDEIYDFVFDKHDVVNWREIKVGNKYLTASTTGYAYLNSETGSVYYYDLDFYSYLFHEESKSDLGFIYKTISSDENNPNGTTRMYVFDSSTGLLDTEKPIDFEYIMSSDFFQIDCDEEGIFYVCPAKYGEDKNKYTAYYNIVKIDLKNRSSEEVIKNTNIYCDKDDNFYKENVLCISKEYIITSYSKLGNNILNKYLINFYNKKTCESIPEKTVELPFKESFHPYDGVIINNCLYIICKNRAEEKPYTEIYKIDLDESVKDFEAEYVIRMDIDTTDNIYIRGQRIYLISSRIESHFIYMWYDVVTGETSNWTGYDVEKLVELWASGNL